MTPLEEKAVDQMTDEQVVEALERLRATMPDGNSAAFVALDDLEAALPSILQRERERVREITEAANETLTAVSFLSFRDQLGHGPESMKEAWEKLRVAAERLDAALSDGTEEGQG